MTFLNTLLLLVAFIASVQEVLREYRLQLKAHTLYENRSYREAESAFEQLAEKVHGQKNKASAGFNLACTLYMQEKYPDAALLFANNAKAGSKYREIRTKAIFNEGNALAMRAIASNEKPQKKILFRQSLNRFKTVLLADPGDGDAKINYEIVSRYLRELETPDPLASQNRIQNNTPAQGSTLYKNMADRLLDNARQDESSLMQRLPQKNSSARSGKKNSKDW